jgi:hypothetical protein
VRSTRGWKCAGLKSGKTVAGSLGHKGCRVSYRLLLPCYPGDSL